MSRRLRWLVTVVGAAVVFGVCLWAARTVWFGWMPRAEADRWVVATAFATVMATVAAAALSWWAGHEPSGPITASADRTVVQRATASGRGRVEQAGGHHNTPSTADGDASSDVAGMPGRTEQEGEASDEGSVTQVGGNLYVGPGDDERQPRP
ncbi:hypothetical protein [Streptomyces sp. NPDC057301]|uniref:hypothetical protein n=1 Tax=Streptomyces sp. NPDC057301 TaxID=3346093 RepID=UPI00363D3C29